MLSNNPAKVKIYNPEQKKGFECYVACVNGHSCSLTDEYNGMVTGKR